MKTRVSGLALLWFFLAGTVFAQTTPPVDPSVFVQSFEGRTGAVVVVEGDVSLDELGDVTITNPQADDCLRYNGTVWVNTPTCGAGGGGLSLNSQIGSTQTLVAGSAGTDFAINSAANVHTFNLPTASAANRGLLSAANWSTFNAKQAGDADLTALAAQTPVQGDLLLGGPSTWLRLGIGVSGLALVSTGATADWQQYDYADLAGVPATFAPADHVFVSATHTVSGLTAGHILTALTSNTFGFAAAVAPPASLYEDGGADEISVAGLSGLLADPQTPDTHVHAAADTTSGTFAAARLPNPSAGALGGVRSLTCGSTDKISAIGTDGIPVCSADDGGGGALSNAYVQMTDGTITAAAAAGDIFKFRSFDNKLTTEVQSNDGTHGDNLLLTLNEANLVLSAIGGAVTDDQVPNTITVDLATLATTATTATTALAGDSATAFFTSGTLEVGRGGTGFTAGTSGGIIYFANSTTLTSSAALGANLPLVGGGAGNAPATGTRSGNTTQFATVTGTKTVSKQLAFDADGNVIASAQDIAAYQLLSEKSAAEGYASLNIDGFVPNTELDPDEVAMRAANTQDFGDGTAACNTINIRLAGVEVPVEICDGVWDFGAAQLVAGSIALEGTGFGGIEGQLETRMIRLGDQFATDQPLLGHWDGLTAREILKVSCITMGGGTETVTLNLTRNGTAILSAGLVADNGGQSSCDATFDTCNVDTIQAAQSIVEPLDKLGYDFTSSANSPTALSCTIVWQEVPIP